MHRLLPTLCLLLTSIAAVAQSTDAIPYPTVAAALESLRAKSGVEVSNQNGFTVITEPATYTLWTFTPAGHPAHPTVVRRQMVREGDDIISRMQVKCEAAKPACDKLAAEFKALDDQIRESLRGNRAR
jgi:hypothetical protein